jgi:hypothetical protein
MFQGVGSPNLELFQCWLAVSGWVWKKTKKSRINLTRMCLLSSPGCLVGLVSACVGGDENIVVYSNKHNTPGAEVLQVRGQGASSSPTQKSSISYRAKLERAKHTESCEIDHVLLDVVQHALLVLLEQKGLTEDRRQRVFLNNITWLGPYTSE